MKIGPKYCLSPIKQKDMCNYNPKCFMSGGLILDNTIVNILFETVEQINNSVINNLFDKIKDDEICLYQGYLQDYTRKKTITDTNKT